jgi:hypothetical protein
MWGQVFTEHGGQVSTCHFAPRSGKAIVVDPELPRLVKT